MKNVKTLLNSTPAKPGITILKQSSVKPSTKFLEQYKGWKIYPSEESTVISDKPRCQNYITGGNRKGQKCTFPAVNGEKMCSECFKRRVHRNFYFHSRDLPIKAIYALTCGLCKKSDQTYEMIRLSCGHMFHEHCFTQRIVVQDGQWLTAKCPLNHSI